MRFRYGAPPDDPQFFPEAEGWSPIWKYGPWRLQLVVLPVGFVLMFISTMLIVLVFPRELFLSLDGAPAMAIPLMLIGFWWILPVTLVLIPVHELLHSVCYPDGGATSRSVVGMWLSKGVFYAHYEGVMSRNRFLLVLVAPYLILTLLPIPLIPMLQALGATSVTIWAVIFSAAIQSTCSCGDAVIFGLVLMQIPSTALMRNKGWKTYWKSPISPDPSLVRSKALKENLL